MCLVLRRFESCFLQYKQNYRTNGLYIIVNLLLIYEFFYNFKGGVAVMNTITAVVVAVVVGVVGIL
jgi:hypothetical protein